MLAEQRAVGAASVALLHEGASDLTLSAGASSNGPVGRKPAAPTARAAPEAIAATAPKTRAVPRGADPARVFCQPLPSSGLRALASLPIRSVPVRRPGHVMSNRAIWNVRLRHVWLATPLKGKRMKRRQRLRIGLEDALARKGKGAAAEPPPAETNS